MSIRLDSLKDIIQASNRNPQETNWHTWWDYLCFNYLSQRVSFKRTRL